MIKPFKQIILLCTSLISFISFAQDSTVVRDFELWTGVTLEKSFLEKKLDFALTQEFRFHDNSTSINNYFTELEAKYKLPLGFSVGGAYRFIRNNRNSGYRNEYRIHFDGAYKHELDRLTLSYRLRYQRFSPIGDVADDDIITKYRFRFKAEYNIKNWKLDPYFSAEGFFASTINNINYVESITETEKVTGFEKLRFTLGTEYKINKVMEIGAFYRVEQELGSYPLHYNTPATIYVAGLNLSFKL